MQCAGLLGNINEANHESIDSPVKFYGKTQREDNVTWKKEEL